MTALNIKATPLIVNNFGQQNFQVIITAADPYYSAGVNQDVQFPCTIGPLDGPNLVFPTTDDAVNYLFSNEAPNYLGSLNGSLGTSFTMGALVTVDQPVLDLLSLKQNTNSNLTAWSSATLLNNKMYYANSGSGFASFDTTSYARGLLNLANQAALQTAAGVSTVGLSNDYNDLTNKPTIPNLKAYQGTTLRTGAFPIFKSGTVSSGVVVFQLTADGTSTGSALFPNGIIDESVNLFVNDATASYQMSYAMSNSNKTLTVTANKLTTANILTGLLGQAAANSAVVKMSVWGY